MSEKKYPIAETFTSIQGEGVHTGTVMTFLRTAGCSVGKPLSAAERALAPGLPVYTEICSTYDGRQFCCDTDFRSKELLTVDVLLSRVPEGVHHVCISGGEPLIHDLVPLITAVHATGRVVHIETSGTRPWPAALVDRVFSHTSISPWVTVSPKKGVLKEMLLRADELKLLVDAEFDLALADQLVSQLKCHVQSDAVFVQPVNYELSLDMANVKRCFEIVTGPRRSWRMSTQLHKVFGVR